MGRLWPGRPLKSTTQDIIVAFIVPVDDLDAGVRGLGLVVAVCVSGEWGIRDQEESACERVGLSFGDSGGYVSSAQRSSTAVLDLDVHLAVWKGDVRIDPPVDVTRGP